MLSRRLTHSMAYSVRAGVRKLAVTGPDINSPPRYTVPGNRNHEAKRREIEAAFQGIDHSRYQLPDALLNMVMSPCLVIYLDVVRRNIEEVLRLCDKDSNRWRCHVKTTKCRVVFRELARAGVRNFKCSTPREADVLAAALFDEGVADGDILVAYPLVGPAVRRLEEVAERWPQVRFSMLCETPGAAATVPRGIGVFVDINLGMNRTGVPLTTCEKDGIAMDIATAVGKGFRGLHAYDGHAAKWCDVSARRKAMFELYDRLVRLDREIETAGHTVGELITAGTPSLTASLGHPGLRDSRKHRVSPGTVVFHDYQYELMNGDLDLSPAAVVLSRVISHPRKGWFTLDAGSKALAAESGHPMCYIMGHPEFEPLTPSEEHLPVDARGHKLPQRGSVQYLVPRHICPSVNLAEKAVIMDRGENGELFFHSLSEIEARAHDTLLGQPLRSATFYN